MQVESINPVSLAKRHRVLSDEIETAKAEQKEIERHLAEQARPHWHNKVDALGKTHGEHRIAVAGQMLKVAITKTVKWDSDLLATIAKSMPADDRATIFKTTLSISEETFADLVEQEYPHINQITLARTVKFSDLTAKPI